MRRGPTGSFVLYLGNNGVLGFDVHYNGPESDFFTPDKRTSDSWVHGPASNCSPPLINANDTLGPESERKDTATLSLIITGVESDPGSGYHGIFLTRVSL